MKVFKLAKYYHKLYLLGDQISNILQSSLNSRQMHEKWKRLNLHLFEQSHCHYQNILSGLLSSRNVEVI